MQKRWKVSDIPIDIQQFLCKKTREYHKSDDHLEEFIREDNDDYRDYEKIFYMNSEDVHEKYVALCDVDGKLIAEENWWWTIPMQSEPIFCKTEQKDGSRAKRVMNFHTHPFGLPIPSSNDLSTSFMDDDGIFCIGGGDNSSKKVYCYEKPSFIEPNTNDNTISRKFLHSKFDTLGYYALAESKFYPFDVDINPGDYINELATKDLNLLSIINANKEFEILSEEKEAIRAESVINNIEKDGIVKVYRFNCNNNNEFVNERDNTNAKELADYYEKPIIQARKLNI